jgi:hypothetical protein
MFILGYFLMLVLTSDSKLFIPTKAPLQCSRGTISGQFSWDNKTFQDIQTVINQIPTYSVEIYIDPLMRTGWGTVTFPVDLSNYFVYDWEIMTPIDSTKIPYLLDIDEINAQIYSPLAPSTNMLGTVKKPAVKLMSYNDIFTCQIRGNVVFPDGRKLYLKDVTISNYVDGWHSSYFFQADYLR